MWHHLVKNIIFKSCQQNESVLAKKIIILQLKYTAIKKSSFNGFHTFFVPSAK